MHTNPINYILEEQKRIEEKLKKDNGKKEKIRKEQELKLKLSEKKVSVEVMEKKNSKKLKNKERSSKIIRFSVYRN